LARWSLAIARVLERRTHRRQPGAEAFEQQLFLVLDVVVDRRLRNLQRRSDVTERGVMVATLVEGPRRGVDHGVTLEGAVAPGLASVAPGRGGGREVRVDGHGPQDHTPR